MELKIKQIVFVFLGSLFLFFSCNTEEKDDFPHDETPLQFLKTELGGCNNQLEEKSIRTGETDADTVIFNLINDTMSLWCGLNYICCAPFITQCDVSGDSILVSLMDTCTLNASCYCRCMCYYTFDFYFNNLANKSYYWQVVLVNPREANEEIFREGILTVMID